MKKIKLLIISIGLLLSLRGFGQDIEDQKVGLYERKQVTYKPENPGSSKLPITKVEIDFVCESLLYSNKLESDKFAQRLWYAITNPKNFDAQFRVSCWSTADDLKPVLADWSEAENEKGFVRYLFLYRFFCSYNFHFISPDTTDPYINERLRRLPPLKTFDTSIVSLNGIFPGKVKERLSQIQPELKKRGLTFMFVYQGTYSDFTAFIVKNEDVKKLQSILNKISLKTVSWNRLMRK